MAKRRRRSTELQHDAEPHKKRQKEAHQPRQLDKAGHHVLSAYFPTLLTLRKYFIARLSSLKRSQAQDRGLVELQSDRIQGSHPLCNLLDTTLVGLDGEVPKGNQITHDIVEATASSPSWFTGGGPLQPEVNTLFLNIFPEYSTYLNRGLTLKFPQYRSCKLLFASYSLERHPSFQQISSLGAISSKMEISCAPYPMRMSRPSNHPPGNSSLSLLGKR